MQYVNEFFYQGGAYLIWYLVGAFAIGRVVIWKLRD